MLLFFLSGLLRLLAAALVSLAGGIVSVPKKLLAASQGLDPQPPTLKLPKTKPSTLNPELTV